jgi:hypothetical protein
VRKINLAGNKEMKCRILSMEAIFVAFLRIFVGKEIVLENSKEGIEFDEILATKMEWGEGKIEKQWENLGTEEPGKCRWGGGIE